MRKLICSFLFAALAVATAGAADLSGKWSGSFDITAPNGETHPDTAFMQLKEDHGQVTGTAGPIAIQRRAVRVRALQIIGDRGAVANGARRRSLLILQNRHGLMTAAGRVADIGKPVCRRLVGEALVFQRQAAAPAIG